MNSRALRLNKGKKILTQVGLEPCNTRSRARVCHILCIYYSCALACIVFLTCTPTPTHNPPPPHTHTLKILLFHQAHSEDLLITHFYYEGWPDHGVPQYATSILGFLRHVRRKHHYTDSAPLLVHCSAGVGRTGTFITLDVMLQKIKEEQTVNVYDFVKHLRKSRCQMVQTEVQTVTVDVSHAVLVLKARHLSGSAFCTSII